MRGRATLPAGRGRVLPDQADHQIYVAMKLALIATLVLPVSAVSGIYRMNLIVNQETQPRQAALVLALVLGVVLAMLVWAKRHDWW